MVKAIAFYFSEDRGRFLENVVFLKLRRVYDENLYYYKTEKDKEVDFYLPKKKTFIQVSQNITNPATREREIQALSEAMGEIKGSSGLIVTEDEKETIFVNGTKVDVVPIFEWLLSKK